MLPLITIADKTHVNVKIGGGNNGDDDDNDIDDDDEDDDDDDECLALDYSRLSVLPLITIGIRLGQE